MVEAHISGANLPYTVLSHERGNVKVVQPVSRDAWIFEGEFTNHFGVPLRFQKNSKRWGCAQTLDEIPSFRKRQGVGEDKPMRGNAEEFVHDRPRYKPCFSAGSPFRERSSHPRVEGGVLISRVEQKVCVDNEQAQPFLLTPPYSLASRPASKKSYNSSRLAMFTLAGPILEVGKRKGRLDLRVARRLWTRDSVTRAEIVSLRSAARRFKSRKSGSGMTSVVFIWKTISPVWKYVKNSG